MLRRFGIRGFSEINDKEYGYLFKLSGEVEVGLKTSR